MQTNITASRHLPAEWDPQDGVLLAWPHQNSDWADMLDEVLPVYLELARQISRFERVIIVTPEPLVVDQQLNRAAIISDRIHLLDIATNDTWIRDFGPITIIADGQPRLLDFGFNGWGLKFAADQDNQVTRHLATTPLFSSVALETVGLILEGGSIESDGNGTLLTTSNCLLNPNRNPHLNNHQLETELRSLFGSQHILWLDYGWLAGDDTDAHIDTLARLGPNDTILYVCCDDPQDEHYEELQRMEEQLRSFTTKAGTPFRLIPLPWPQAQYDGEKRLPATYANFLIINDAVLVPCYQDAADSVALATIGTCFPDREVIGIDCLPLIKQHGSLHCVTMQLPSGVLTWQQ
ncbi:MAG: agmatine deiminase family protein [Desulfuromonadales bacterium]|nr:agmatine deiminase family protein [Desulfuromonadales bacterium]